MTFLTIKATAVFVASALLCIATPAASFAQDTRGSAASADVASLLQQGDAQLSELEQAARSIETSGVVTVETAVKYQEVLAAYADTMHQATDAALNSAALAARTKGAQGSVQSLQAFEKVAKDHEVRTAALQRRLAAISEKMNGGSIKTVGFGPELRAIVDRLNTPIVAPAEAALAIPALSPCGAQLWAACIVAIAAAVGPAKTAWNQYQSCQANAPGVPPQPTPPSKSPWYTYPYRWSQYVTQNSAYSWAVVKRAAYQSACVAVFVAKIA